MSDLKLFKVTCRGMRESHGTAFAVAKDSAAAYQAVLDSLNKRDLGFFRDRALLQVELVAEDSDFPSCETRLYLAQGATHDQA